MDDRHFDSLARSLAAPKSRRGFLAALGALVTGANAAGLTSAQSACPPGQTANRKGDCSCPPGTAACPTGCFDHRTDPANCGACGSICLPGQVCRKGACACPDGRQPSPDSGCLDQPAPTTTAAPATTTPQPTTTTTTTAAPTTTTSTTTTTTTPPPVVTVTSAVTSTDPRSSCFLTNCPYDALVFEHGGGALSLNVRGAASGGGTLADPYLYLFDGPIPDNCGGLYAFNDDGGCGNESYIEIANAAPGSYTAVVVGYQCGLGTYTMDRNTFVGAEVCP